MQLTSDLFTDQATIPTDYTCKGRNISPSLHISDIPSDTQSLALIMHDPDAPNGDFLHWTMWNISPTTSLIAEATVPEHAVQGMNGFGAIGYGGPCPPSGTHRYVFELYALDSTLDLPEGADRQSFESAIASHIIDSARFTGLFSA